MPKTVSASRTLASLASTWMLASCAATLPPTPPAPEIRIPTPPVQLGQQHSQTLLPDALTYSQKASAYIDTLRLLLTSEQPK